MDSKRKLSHNITSSANKLKLDSINKIFKIDSGRKRKQKKDAISKQISRVVLSELIKNSPQLSTHIEPPDFKTFLEHNDNIEVFNEFLKASYCQENLEFYLACERYRKLDPDRVGKQMIKFMATQIFNDFLSQDARQPVNVDSSCIERIRNNMKDPQPDLLRDAQKEIFNLMKTDCYPRFYKTWKLDKELAENILSRHRQQQQHDSQHSNQQITPDSLDQSQSRMTIRSQKSQRVHFNESDLSLASTYKSERSRSIDISSKNECPSECPYYRVGRLPCQRHVEQPMMTSRFTKPDIRPNESLLDDVIDLKKIHHVPNIGIRKNTTPPPPPLPPKPDDIDYKHVGSRPYLPYVGKVFDV